MNAQIVKQLLRECWSRESSSLYTEDNPAKGQCSVTALVIQDFYGGELYKTKVGKNWHFYNCINEVFYDVTAEQFDSQIEYLNLAATREEAFADTNVLQYAYLSNAFQRCLVNWQFDTLDRTKKHFKQSINSYRIPEDIEQIMQILVAVLR